MDASIAGQGEDRLPQRKFVEVRLATPDDVAAIMQVIRAVVPVTRASGNLQWDSEYPHAGVFEEDIAAGQLWVAEVGSSLAGVVALTTDQTPEYVEAGWDLAEPGIVVHRLAVDPKFQGQGVAAALLFCADRVGRERGILRVLADTNTKNQAMQRLLPKLGYTYAGEIGLEFRPGLRFLCYEKLL